VLIVIIILGQYYNIALRDNNRYNGDIVSVISINFHDESHRLGATDYWKFWLTQQKDVETARAVEIGNDIHLENKLFANKQAIIRFDKIKRRSGHRV
jgi:hypothetical protein